MVARGGDEAAPRLDQAPREQKRRSDGVLAVLILRPLGFLRQVEGVAHRGGEDHLPGLRGVGVEVGMLGLLVERAVAAIDRLQECRAALDRRLRDRFWRLRSVTAKSGLLESGMHIGSCSPPRNAARK